jgi:predicted kinase
MVGPAGCGKSALAALIAEKLDADIVSSDNVREEIFGNASVQKDHGKVFARCHELTREALRRGHSVIFDATNLYPKHRKAVIRLARECGDVRVRGVVYTGDFETCLEQNKMRERQVPEGVIELMYGNLHRFEPVLSEGFDDLVTMESLRNELR